jgi:ATP-binding cassette subfamily B protein
MSRSSSQRRFLAPEVVQTSAMDCGPAALKCLLEGFGVPVSYGRLREACQTDVDGTSIDRIERVARELGLEVEQVMLPVDHLLHRRAAALPALVVALTPSRSTHFSVIWSDHGRWLQVMDPAIGRRWPRRADLVHQLYVHTQELDAGEWRDWAGSEDFLGVLRHRLGDLGVATAASSDWIARALADETWRSLAALDAAARMARSLVDSGGIRSGRQAAALIERLFERERGDASGAAIPESYWFARESPAAPAERLRIRGAVLLKASGRLPADAAEERPVEPALSRELAEALREPPTRPARELLRYLRADGLLTPWALGAALLLSAGGVIVEALLFRVLFDLGSKLGVAQQRLGAIAALALFSFALLCLELPLSAALWRYGRRLEARLRLAFLAKIPRLDDRYFQSRLISDMVDRAHGLTALRGLPALGGQLVRLVFVLGMTAAGMIWLDPAGAPAALSVACVGLLLPLATQRRLAEGDLRIRNHNGALGRCHLDALAGLVAIRTHGAEPALRGEHEGLLVEWARASFGLLRSALAVEAIEVGVGFGLAAWLLYDHLSRGTEVGSVLLLVYWALNLPMLGQQIAGLAQQYPAHRNVTLRALEPLGAPEGGASADPRARLPEPATAGPAAIALRGVSVRAGGHWILRDVELEIAPGGHVAIVGASGAGKSSLVGLLLGWHRPAAGEVRVDGEPLDAARLERLRTQTAWVDPSVQLWNRTLFENLRYGAPEHAPLELAIGAADLEGLLERLPEGLQTPLGEGGALVSGGEGQRVRLGRALLRSDARLVILDEPFRGLDRERRRQLLQRARQHWRGATLLCVTHDVGDTREFERVLVVEHGRIAEDAPPEELAGQPGSRYRQLLDAETAVRTGLWASREWRRIRIANGRLAEEVSASPGAG